MAITELYFKIFPEAISHRHTYLLKRFVREIAAKYDRPGKKLIDIGAGDCQYQGYFQKLDYFSQDIKNNQQQSIDYLGEMKILPSQKFDYVLCTQVLEHLAEPQKAFQEFYRILKKNGKLFLTTHLAFEEHGAPTDYFRFTRYGLKYLAEKAGFKIERIEPQGGRFVVLAKELQILWPRIIKNRTAKLLFYLLFSLPLFCLNFILISFDFLDKDKTLTLNYEAIFRKS